MAGAFEPRFELWHDQAQDDQNQHDLLHQSVEPRFELRFRFELGSSKLLKKCFLLAGAFGPRFELWHDQAQDEQNEYDLLHQGTELRFELRFRFGLGSSNVVKNMCFYWLGRLGLDLSFGITRLKMPRSRSW